MKMMFIQEAQNKNYRGTISQLQKMKSSIASNQCISSLENQAMASGYPFPLPGPALQM